MLDTFERRSLQQRQQEYETHKFLDASATVHAGLFGARRLPEIKCLWRHLVQDQLNTLGGDDGHGVVGKRGHNKDAQSYIVQDQAARKVGKSGGGKISSRHLRRRTGSHRRRRRHRFPRGDSNVIDFGANKTDCAAAGGGTDGIPVDKREETDHTAATSVAGQNTHAKPTQKLGKKKENNESSATLFRRARRKPALMNVSHSSWWQSQTPTSSITSPKEDVDADTTQLHQQSKPHNWIPTHLWHAKRFHMSHPPLFSWSVPLVHSNRGSRASLRLASSPTHPKCTIQDATWEIDGCAIVLEVAGQPVSKSEFEPSKESDGKSNVSLAATNSKIMDQLVSDLQRICGQDASFLKEDEVLSGRRAGEGLVYERDAFPVQPIGPATFFFCRRNFIRQRNDTIVEIGTCTDNSKIGSEITGACVSILVHPSIRQKVITLVKSLISCGENYFLSSAPLSLLRIRGRSSSLSLNEVLSVDRGKNHHLTESDVELDKFETNVAEHGTLIELNDVPSNENTTSCPPTSKTAATSNVNDNTATSLSAILLKSHQPNCKLPHNIACSGWDILCHPSLSSAIFQSFVSRGGACAIGLTEDARAQLEACPPLPIFPRDYPDTEMGKAYWQGYLGISHTEDNDVWKDWLIIRECIEGSWGKIHTSLKRVQRCRDQSIQPEIAQDMTQKKFVRECVEVKAESKTGDEVVNGPVDHEPMQAFVKTTTVFGRQTKFINWMHLASPCKEMPSIKRSADKQQSIVVVRGSFGIPFIQVLHGCGRLHMCTSRSKTTDQNRQRRPRRPVRPPSECINASPLSKEESAAHSSLCRQLCQSLSLPAVLRCEVLCDGKGTLNPGDELFAFVVQDDTNNESVEESDYIDKQDHGIDNNMQGFSSIGAVVAGGFSPSRGRCHGTGFVGAARFIKALDGTVHGMGMSMPSRGGEKEMVLRVLVRGNSFSPFGHAVISVLL